MSSLIGKTIKKVRPMTYEEMINEHWEYEEQTMVLILSDGSKIYPSQDYEGNGPGALFGTKANGDKFYV